MLDLTNHPNREVLDATRQVLELQAAYIEAGRRFGEIEDTVLADMPPCPPRPDTDEGQEILDRACLAVLKRFHAISPEVDEAVAELRRGALADMADTYLAWQADWHRRHTESGATTAEVALDDAMSAMIAGVEALAELHATTLEGLLAKATVFQSDPHDDQNDHHYQRLAMSVMADLKQMAERLNPSAGATTAPAS